MDISNGVEIEVNNITFQNPYHTLNCQIKKLINHPHLFYSLSLPLFTSPFSHLFISETRLNDFPIIFLLQIAY